MLVSCVLGLCNYTLILLEGAIDTYTPNIEENAGACSTVMKTSHGMVLMVLQYCCCCTHSYVAGVVYSIRRDCRSTVRRWGKLDVSMSHLHYTQTLHRTPRKATGIASHQRLSVSNRLRWKQPGRLYAMHCLVVLLLS